MNGPFRVAQANGTAASSTTATPVRIYQLTKPLTDQAVMVNLGYDQKVKIDFSAIANEKITLVHVGEKLIILFDNQSTVTVEPVFKSRADGLGNETRDDITVEMSPGRDISLTEFTNLFPISTDTSVLPASYNDGNSDANVEASGAHFTPAAVDPLPPVPTNVLAPQEELGSFVVEFPTGFLPIAPVVIPNNPAPAPGLTIVAGVGLPLAVDESFIPGIGSQAVVAGSPASNIVTQPFASSFTVDAPGGVQSITYALTLSSNGVDFGLIDSVTGNHVFLFLQDGQVVGREGSTSAQAAAGPIDFTLTVDATGHVTMTELRGVDQGAGESPDISEGAHLAAGLVSLTATVTDNNSNTASASVDLGPNITVHDDGPTITAIGTGPAISVDESFLTLATNGIDGSTPNPANTMATADFTGVFTHVNGADGAAVAYALSITGGNGAASGLVDAQTGLNDVLVLNGNTIEGHVGSVGGALAFTVAVDPATGIVTLTEDRSVKQGTPDTPTDLSEGISLTAGALNLTATVTDGDGDNQSATIDLGKQVFFLDDGPRVTAVSSGVTAALDEGNTDTGSPPTSTPATINTGAIVKGDDPDVAGTGYISQAISTGALVTPTIAFGADGPAASAATAYALTVTNAVSGLHVTDGAAINLIDVNGDGSVIVGVVQAGSTFAGQAAFAISINSTTGVVTVEQYLSLHQDSLSSTPDDAVSMLAGHLGITVTATDGDGDKAVSNVVDVSTQITFDDDGPRVTAVSSGVTTALDEGNTDSGSPPTSTPATINTGAIVKGDDPDVAGTGYISHAISTGALVTPTIAFGADGPAASAAAAYGLTVTNAVSGLHVTDGAAINLVDVNGNGSVIVGVVQAGSTFVGQAAFAISIDSSTGVVTVEQYLSLHQDSLPTRRTTRCRCWRVPWHHGDGDRRRRRQGGEQRGRRLDPDHLR